MGCAASVPQDETSDMRLAKALRLNPDLLDNKTKFHEWYNNKRIESYSRKHLSPIIN